MISIIIPVYNQAGKLKKCLRSIANQSYVDYEVIIVNDGSDDEPNKVFKLFEHLWAGRCQFINQVNQGANVARNRGAELARGTYLIFCDADIVMKPDMLMTMLDKLTTHQESSYAYSAFKFGWKKFNPGEFDGQKLRQRPLIHTTSLIRAEDFPGFDKTIKRFQDWDLWLTMLEQGHTGVFVNQLLFTMAGGGTMSIWLPSCVYKLCPNLAQVKKYQQAEAVIKQKHGLL